MAQCAEAGMPENGCPEGFDAVRRCASCFFACRIRGSAPRRDIAAPGTERIAQSVAMGLGKIVENVQISC